MISFVKDSFFSLLWKVANLGINIIIAALISRGLGPEGRGSYDLMLVFVMFFVLFVNLGMENALVYFIGQKKHSIESLISTSVTYCVVIYLLLAFIVIGLFQLEVVAFFNQFSAMNFYIGLVSVFPQIISILLRHTFLGLKQIKKYNLCITVEFVAFFIMLLTLNFFEFTLNGVLLLYMAAGVISLIVHVFYFARLKVPFNPVLFKKNVFKDLFSYGVKFFGAGFATFWQSRIGLLYLNSYHGESSVGQFTTANKLPQLLVKIPNEISLILYPYASSMTSEEESSNFIAFVLKWLVLYPAVFFTLITMAILPQLMDLFFGAEYAKSVPAAFFLVASAVLAGCTNVVANYLSAKGQVKFSAYAGFMNFAVIAVGGLLIIESYDYYGLAFLALIGALVGFVYVMIKVKRLTKLPWEMLLVVNRKEFGQMKELIMHFTKRIK